MLPIMFGVMAIFLFVIGLRGILIQRSFLVSNRWMPRIMFVVSIPLILQPLFIPTSAPFGMKWANSMIYTLGLVMMYFAFKGYTAYAITETSFRDALLAALQKLQ